MSDLQQALSKAKIQLMASPDSVFFTTICFSLRFNWDNTIPTAGTNGISLQINPDFFMSLSPEERVFLLIHESAHVAYDHISRLQHREHSKFNIAADHVINLMLLERGFRMPKNGLADPQYRDMSTEQVYDLLPNNPPPPPWEDLIAADPGNEVATQQGVQEIIMRAALQSKMQGDRPGTIPGEIQIFLDKLLSPKLPWYAILRKYFNAMAKCDYTFRKPNRRFFPRHHLPSLYSESLMDIAVAVDTSGSVSDIEFTQFISELHMIMKMMKPSKLTLIQFDSQIKHMDEIRSVNDLSRVTFTGRGGTRIDPVLNWANINKPQLLLVFTDGFFTKACELTATPIVWLIHNNPQFNANFGKIIHYHMER